MTFPSCSGAARWSTGWRRGESASPRTAAGFDTGGTDGRVGNDTMKAIRDFQVKAGLQPADGYGGLKVLAKLRQGG